MTGVWVTGAQVASFDEESILYVSLSGDDANDGMAPWKPKRHIKNSVSSLPTTGSGGTLHHYGTIYIGPGVFLEDPGIECNADIQFIGYGPSDRGTVVRLNPGSNADLFTYTVGVYTDAAQSVLFRDLCIDGISNTGCSGVVLKNGGYHCDLERVKFRDWATNGLQFVDNALTSSLWDCGWVRCGVGVYATFGGSVANLSIFGGQTDDCITNWLRIDHTGAGFGNQCNIFAMKAERQNNGETDKLIYLKPRTSGGGNQVRVKVDGLCVSGAANVGTAAIYEENQPGIAFKVQVYGYDGAVGTGGYTYLFDSAKTSTTQAGGNVDEYTN